MKAPVFLIVCIVAVNDSINLKDTISRFSNVTSFSAINAFSFCRTMHYSTIHMNEPYSFTSSIDSS